MKDSLTVEISIRLVPSFTADKCCQKDKQSMLKTFLLINKFTALRCLQTTRTYARRRVVADPGIRGRLKMFSNSYMEDPESLEEVEESDFMNVGEAHKQFKKEEKSHQHKISTVIVGRKYFKEKGINFLTFSEKEQIRSLHEGDPQEWTVEKLSESFPADPYAIGIIIRNKWQPRDAKRVQKHDESVRKNWHQFQAGELEVEPILAEHLKKFAHRDFEETAKPKVDRKYGIQIPKPARTEFLSMITSCKKYSEDKKEDKSQPEFLKLGGHGLKLPDNINAENNSCVLQGKLENSDNRTATLEEYQKTHPEIVTQGWVKLTETSKVNLLKVKKVSKDEESLPAMQFNNVNKKVFESLAIQEEIEIPKKVWKEGKLYKVGDCFYSDDGEFLYRVPGLT